MADVALMENPMTTAGDTLYGGASGAPTRLAKGTAGQVWKMNAGATAPEWSDESGGSAFVGARAYNSTTQSISPGTDTAVTFNTEEYDTDSIHSTASNTSRFTKPTGKTKARVTALVSFAASDVGTRYIYLRTDGTTEVRGSRATQNGPTSASNSELLQTSATIDVTSVTYIECMARQSTVSALNIGHATADTLKNTMSVEWLD